MTDLLSGDLSDGDATTPGRGGSGERVEGEGARGMEVDPWLEGSQKITGCGMRV